MASVDQTPLEADKMVDARGLACPLPLLKAKQALAAMEAGQRLELWRAILVRGKISPVSPRSPPTSLCLEKSWKAIITIFWCAVSAFS